MEDVCVSVDPGVCGFVCSVKVRKREDRSVTIEISGSECRQIGRLSENLKQLTLREIFMPLTRNPVYVSAQQAGCHPSCAVPLAIVKASEAAMGMALPREVRIRFDDTSSEGVAP